MKELNAMASRKFPHWLNGQLRDENPLVRRLTVELLLELDYLPAYIDLKQAMLAEQDTEVKEVMGKILFELQLN